MRRIKGYAERNVIPAKAGIQGVDFLGFAFGKNDFSESISASLSTARLRGGASVDVINRHQTEWECCAC